jgi:hypothetical protein
MINVKVGDYVAIWLKANIIKAEVTKITNTQFIALDMRFNRRSGIRVGDTQVFDKIFAEPWTEETAAKQVWFTNQHRARVLSTRLANYPWHTLSIDQLTVVINAMNESGFFNLSDKHKVQSE